MEKNSKHTTVFKVDNVELVKPDNVKTVLDDLPNLEFNNDLLNMESVPEVLIGT